MENRQVPLRSRRVCRFCLTESEPLNYIYDQNLNKPFQAPLSLQIMSIVSIEVYASDGMPQMICTMCRWNLERSYKFKQQCKKADEALKNYPISGMLPRPFPIIHSDPPERMLKRSQDQSPQNDSKKSRLDNGDKERREKQKEMYEEEQDEGNSEQDMDSRNEKEETKLEPGEIRVHACDQCDKTFPLHQSLVIHMIRAHRDRTHKCEECGKMFFSKYDLNKHTATHSEDKPYSCPICNKQFTRANLLQRHEKVHRDELRYGCQHCDREFFTTEELEKHEESVHKTPKQFQCNICNKKFTYKQGLERHELLHNEDKNFVCDYCKETFRTSTKLARHLTTHAGHRPYVCKLCPRNFLLSHHLSRHMRTHSVEKKHVCEDCGKAFKRKESLEVHALTHAKRSGPGLTCDVCQESCRNRADYVTHIKQHIEAGEKMGPDGLQPESKDKMELDDSEEDEEEEEDQYSDDDYEPPAYVVKTLPKPVKRNVEEEEEEGERLEDEGSTSKEQVVYLRNKDGNVVKKTIKTCVPMQRKEVKPGLKEEGVKRDDTDAQVQKIVTSIFKEHKIPLKHQVDSKETIIKKEEKAPGSQGPSMRSAVKVIKRILVRKPDGSITTTTSPTATTTIATKEVEASATPAQATPAPAPTGQPKPNKRVIVRKIIREGDTTREIVMNPDGTLLNAEELAKISKKNIVKRVVVKRPLDKSQTTSSVQAILQSVVDQKTGDLAIPKTSPESAKFELKTLQPSTSQKEDTTVKEKLERLERLEKVVEQHDLKIGELVARNHPEAEIAEEMLPERHDSDDEQQLPLKRVFVKRKQSVYDEEKEYGEDKTAEEENLKSALDEDHIEPPKREANSKVYGNRKVQQKIEKQAQEAQQKEVDEINQELSNILESTDDVVKMQEVALSSLTEISNMDLGEVSKKWTDEKENDVEKMEVEPLKAVEEIKDETEETVKDNKEMEMEIDSTQEMDKTEKNSLLTTNPVALEIPETANDASEETKVEEPAAKIPEEKNTTVNEEKVESIEDELSKMEG